MRGLLSDCERDREPVVRRLDTAVPLCAAAWAPWRSSVRGDHRSQVISLRGCALWSLSKKCLFVSDSAAVAPIYSDSVSEERPYLSTLRWGRPCITMCYLVSQLAVRAHMLTAEEEALRLLEPLTFSRNVNNVECMKVQTIKVVLHI